MDYRDFFHRRYMLDYTSDLSWDDTFTFLWYLYSSRWRHKNFVESDPCFYTYPPEGGSPYATYSSPVEQTMISYLRTKQWKIR